MKLSVSLSDDDVAALDEYMRSTGVPSRSAALRRAIHALRQENLEEEYEAAWLEWEASADRVAWEGVTGDGII